MEFTWGVRVREIRESVEENTSSPCLPPELTWTTMSCLETRAFTPLVVPAVSLSCLPAGPHVLHPYSIVMLSLHAPTPASSQSFELFLKLTEFTSISFHGTCITPSSLPVAFCTRANASPYRSLLFKNI